ncbi:hypothetical protein LI328DRAFT_24006 [Trichoderma asperelloides]|nr:hypothetical protein LI328DRAFT_24006 [Trichoderma asperelloides]
MVHNTRSKKWISPGMMLWFLIPPWPTYALCYPMIRLNFFFFFVFSLAKLNAEQKMLLDILPVPNTVRKMI